MHPFGCFYIIQYYLFRAYPTNYSYAILFCRLFVLLFFIYFNTNFDISDISSYFTSSKSYVIRFFSYLVLLHPGNRHTQFLISNIEYDSCVYSLPQSHKIKKSTAPIPKEKPKQSHARPNLNEKNSCGFPQLHLLFQCIDSTDCFLQSHMGSGKVCFICFL